MSIGRSGDRAIGRSGHWANPKIRRGLKSPSHSKSRLKPTEGRNSTIGDFSPLKEDFSYETGISIPVVLGDSPIDPDRTLDPDCPLQDWAYPQARRGLKSPSHSQSRF